MWWLFEWVCFWSLINWYQQYEMVICVWWETGWPTKSAPSLNQTRWESWEFSLGLQLLWSNPHVLHWLLGKWLKEFPYFEDKLEVSTYKYPHFMEHDLPPLQWFGFQNSWSFAWILWWWKQPLHPWFHIPQKVLRTVDMLRWDTSKHPLIFGTGWNQGNSMD